ncbi:armadillo-type protein [Pisolithus orientalis]|uniref:armadillo-type protein n=1 Tax=Pisolithus orientalis TaxID=936130 RepID=UPI002224AFA5|nr:armadillo-type protein [Pisolithus orientalis]KAI6032934.1 armadillo-type protein [Pisolithus orientalis]
MDVSFASSGAMSRAHYSLVRRVETATSVQAADRVILDEINTIQSTLEQPHLSIKVCKESLILLLYSAMALSVASPGDLSFAFHHAVNLAELGESILDKRIGYTFCLQMMPPNHELHLMLVNTLRKDLESTSIGRICLAMDILMQIRSEDVAPAVQSRLRFFLRDKNDSVRRRAHTVYYALFHRDPDHVKRLEELLTHAGDPDIIPSNLVVASKLQSESMARLLNSHLHNAWLNPKHSVYTILRALREGRMNLDSRNVPLIFDVVRHASLPPTQALLDAFALLSTIPSDVITEYQAKLSYSPAAGIRHLLKSSNANEQYIFISCLSFLDPSSWAGDRPGNPAVFDEWEVQEIIKLLNSHDNLIRKATLKVLYSVNPSIVATYYSQLTQSVRPELSVAAKGDCVLRLLDVMEVQCQEDSEQYAKLFKELFAIVEGDVQGRIETLPVLEGCVDRVLNRVRDADTISRISLVTALVIPLIEPENRVGPTLMVVICALVCEHCAKLPISPVEILRGMAKRLVLFSPSLQDVCLLSMLRLSAECSEVPEEVIRAVQELSRSSGRYIRNRCEQLLSFARQRHILTDIISREPSSSLPDFLSSLTKYQHSSAGRSSPRQPSSESPGSLEVHHPLSVVSLNKLRYEAYPTPQPVSSLKNLAGQRPDETSLRSPGNVGKGVSKEGSTTMPPAELENTVTPGELTLAVAEHWLESDQAAQVHEDSKTVALDDLASRVDLIALDSPFIADHVNTRPEPDFEERWNSMQNSNLRGWCEASTDTILEVLRTLQLYMRVIAIDQPPFEGEVKVLVHAAPADKYAALRLRDGNDEGCLWRLRCDDLALRMTIKRLLEGM